MHGRSGTGRLRARRRDLRRRRTGYLQRFPIHAIKIDQSFVRSINSDNGSNTIVHATIDLGHHLGLYVIAEGIEDRAAWTSLAAFGCDIAQRFFVAQPMPVARFRDWNAEWRTREAAGGCGVDL